MKGLRRGEGGGGVIGGNGWRRPDGANLAWDVPMDALIDGRTLASVLPESQRFRSQLPAPARTARGAPRPRAWPPPKAAARPLATSSDGDSPARGRLRVGARTPRERSPSVATSRHYLTISDGRVRKHLLAPLLRTRNLGWRQRVATWRASLDSLEACSDTMNYGLSVRGPQ